MTCGLLRFAEIAKELVDTNTVNVVKKDGSKFINQYEVVKDLGKGSFGKVRALHFTLRKGD